MKNKSQEVQSAKVLSPQKTQLISEAKLHPEDNWHDVFLKVYKPKETIYTYQIGKFPHRYIRGNKYQMILHKIDGKSA